MKSFLYNFWKNLTACFCGSINKQGLVASNKIIPLSKLPESGGRPFITQLDISNGSPINLLISAI